ncbi:hypothetical protein AMTRI_Chr05g63570 [Amborella trichopoda]
MTIPAGKTFLLNPTTFRGPCKSPAINIQVHEQTHREREREYKVSGNILAPSSISSWGNDKEHWIHFKCVDGLSIQGSGTIDGQGHAWWPIKSAQETHALSFDVCTNLKLRDLHIVNSQQRHIAIHNSNTVYIGGLHINSPEDSPNSDGIHIQSSQHVNVENSFIATGDDCISIGDGTYDVNASKITCGPGHGISVGSLGKDGSRSTAEMIHVKDSFFIGTKNGARIKTWQGGSGFARNIIFENLIFTDVENPIIIDQYYCPNKGCKNQTSAVKVSDVQFIGVHGTCKSEVAVSIACSESIACTNIVVNGLEIRSSEPQVAITTYCLNAHGTAQGLCSPIIERPFHE